jgi:membrane-bound lytic murein transglycosylase D
MNYLFKNITLAFIVCLLSLINPAISLSQAIDTTIQFTDIDTLKDEKIDEVIHASKPPEKNDVKYVSEVTKYGFKDLFQNYVYNPSMPYSSQVNPSAEQYMQDYLKAHGRHLKNLKKTSLSYFNYIDAIFSQYGLPKELKYLAVIESDLKSNALSIKGARGPWQFMPYTARDFGLQVNNYVDDRTDYYKSTNAAAKYLLSLYKSLKDWLLVVAAYNGGPGRVYTAIRKSNSRNFWNLQYYLPEESRNHVKKFIATHYIMEADNTGNDLNNGSSAPTTITATEDSLAMSSMISGRYKAAIIAKNIEMEINEFDRYNPGFDNIIATGSSYNLRLPSEKMQLFEERKLPILKECVQYLLSAVK